jgi:murein DD-endopeptidase MepM/ murein hydrolase activator NlpD
MTFMPHLRNAAFIALLLGACAAPDPSRVHVTMMGTNGAGRANQMTARAGDNIETLARNAGLDIADILNANGLVPSQPLVSGQRLTTPLPNDITVLEGDSVDTISRALGIDKKALVENNGLNFPYQLQRGQVLKIPQNAVASREDRNAPTPLIDQPVFEDNLPPATPSSPITTTETAGGQKMHSSASGMIVEEDLLPPPNAKQATGPTKVQEQIQQQAALSKPAPPAKPSAKISPLPSGAPKLSWPLNGSMLSDYGPKSDGQKNDGINIGAPQGTTVRTAAMGDVVYVGDNVAGFGNLILIRHGGGYATAYGHVQSPLVKRGDRVTAGQAIAQVGKTGNVATPQLHFEVRKGTQHVNPNDYLN